MEKIPILGIQRYHDGVNTDGGSCDEIINCRRLNGEWILMRAKEELHDLSWLSGVADFDFWYNHPVSTDDKFIAHKLSPNIILEIDTTLSTTTTLIQLLSEVCEKIYHFGDIVIVVTDKNVHYLRFLPDTATYEELPQIEHGLYAVSSVNPWRGAAWAQGTVGTDTLVETMAKLRDDINRLEKRGYINGHTLFRFVFELFDGSTIQATTPYYYFMGMPEWDGGPGNNAIEADLLNTPHIQDNGTTYIGYWRYFAKPRVTLIFTVTQLSILEKYQGLIKKLVVYMSKPIKDRDENITNEDDMLDGHFNPNQVPFNYFVYPSNPDAETLVRDCTSFYRVHDISIEELTTTTEFTINAGDVNDIESKQALDIDDFTAHRYFSDKLYEYNSRLHIGRTETLLNDGYNQSLKDNITVLTPPDIFEHIELLIDLADPIYVGDASVLGSVFSITKLYINGSNKYVIKQHSKLAVYKDGPTDTDRYMVLNSVISYPDDRAVEIKYVILDGSDYKLLETIPLTKHKYFNFASGETDLHEWERTLTDLGAPFTATANVGFRVLRYKAIELVTTGSIVPFTENNLYADTNRVQISQVNNPFYYPAKHSYRIGRITNEIIGLMSQAVPMSEGQYGYFPLMVFTQEGIFSLEQGIGDILYKSIQPVSLNVCNNPDSIIAVKDGILFVSEKGLMVLSGRQVNEIGAILEGSPKSDIKADTDYLNAINGTDLVVDLEDAISADDFKLFLEDAIIAYDQVRDEILISSTKQDGGSRKYNYSYIFSITENVWYKTSQAFTALILNHPNWVMVDGDTMYKMEDEVTGSVDSEFLIKTNPFKFGSNDLKSIQRIIARLDLLSWHAPFSYDLTVGNIGNHYGYDSLNFGSLNPTIFEGTDIIAINANTGSGQCFIRFSGSVQILGSTELHLYFDGYSSNPTTYTWDGGSGYYAVINASLAAFIASENGNTIGLGLRIAPKLAFYVFGSLDNKEWKLISGIRTLLNTGDQRIHQLMLRKIKTTAKYFVVFMASPAISSVLSGFEVDVEIKVPKKVR